MIDRTPKEQISDKMTQEIQALRAQQVQDQVNQAFAELEDAVTVFQQAIVKFRGVYEPKAVDLTSLSSGLEATLFEIDEDITENLEQR